MLEKIINLLRKEKGYLSGEEISERLGISRAGVWKQIENLRSLGYEIEAFPHRGYRLVSAPDRLLPEEISWELGTEFMGRNIFSFETLDSTMDFAYELGIKKFPEGTIVCSETQKKGRGRLGRNWFSPKYKGLYFSILLRPKILPQEASQLTILSAVAVSTAIKEITALECLIKWPNDILVNGEKVGGILTEMQAEIDAVRFVIIGIGINVNTEKRNLPPQASSLKEEKGEKVSRIELFKGILQKIEKYYLLFQDKGFSPILQEWKRHSSILGHQIKIIAHSKTIEGEAIDLDSQGALLVRKDSGFIEKVLVGDVIKVY
ncbi:MAG: biotin--[acetyl-CoA-carboxylase] ligase [Candidatus Omnitrophica bacterium]|nr:biotin--[acetyl-CoA-carboxylase] ligase [Candidatus Omnitrophota bacterium]MCM8798268.1 biotin--[acetyl-CoA-carboxylase] ligase [Candidatus Omnitrophota bacterium]